MSWLLLNIVLAVQIIVVYLLSVNVNNMLNAIREIREWMLPFGEDLTDIREEMTRFVNDVQDRVLPMLKNIRYIAVPATLAVFANLAGHEIVWVPFWAGVGFTLESIYQIYMINAYGEAMNINLAHAEDTIYERALEAEESEESAEEIS